MKIRAFAVIAAAVLVAAFSSCNKEEPVVPVINISETEISIDAEGGEERIVYSVENSIDGETIEVKNDADWLTIDTQQARVIYVSADKNESGDKRSAVITLNYAGAESKSISVTQEAFEAPITLTILSTEDVKVTFSVETLDPDLTWTGQIVGKEWFDEMGSEDEIFDADYEYYLLEAKYADMTIEEYLAGILNKGSFQSITFGGLDPLSEYVIYVYGMNTAGERTTAIYSAETTTLEPYQGPITFSISTSVENHIVYAQVIPDHEGVPFWLDIMPKADLDAAELSATDEEERIREYGQSLIEEQIQRYLDYDYITDRAEYVESMSYDYSVMDFNFEGLPNTEYIVYACKFDEDANLIGDLAYAYVTTEAVEMSDNQITVTLGDVTQTTLDLTVETSNEDPYITVALESSWIEDCTTDQEIYDILVNDWAGSVWNLEYYMCYGSIEGRMAYLTPDTDHTLVTFGYTANTLTTPMQKHTFRTLPAGDPDECEFEFIIDNIKAREADVYIRPHDTSVKYYWDIFFADATNDDVVAKVEEVKNSLYEGMAYFQSYMTYLDEYVTISNLFPEYSYKIAAIPVSCEPDENGTYHVNILGDAVFSEVFTTKESKVADITITAGFEKYYDGKILSDASPDRYGAWEDYAYVPMKATIEGEYEYYRYSMFEYQEGLEDPELYSDALIVDNLLRVGVNYDAVFRGFWDKKQMIAAVAIDFDGNYSPVFREVVEFSRDGVSDPADIIGSAEASSKSDAAALFSAPAVQKQRIENENIRIFNQNEIKSQMNLGKSEIKSQSESGVKSHAEVRGSEIKSLKNKDVKRYKMVVE